MSCFWTSDLHLGHRMVSEIRGFESPDIHDQVLADNWDEVVRKDDIIYIIGDLTLQNPAAVVEWVNARPGRKRLICGNHDSCHPMHRRYHRTMPAYLEMFETVMPFERRRFGYLNVLMSHFPYQGAGEGERELEERYPQWRLPDLGLPLLHGHTHSSNILSTGRMIHVGLDAHHLAPVSESTIAMYLEQLPAQEVPHE